MIQMVNSALTPKKPRTMYWDVPSRAESAVTPAPALVAMSKVLARIVLDWVTEVRGAGAFFFARKDWTRKPGQALEE